MRARGVSTGWAFGLALALAALAPGGMAQADDSGGQKDCSKLEPGSSKHARCLERQLEAAADSACKGLEGSARKDCLKKHEKGQETNLDQSSACKDLQGDQRKKCLKQAGGGVAAWACKGLDAGSQAYKKCVKEEGRFAESDCSKLDKGSKAYKQCVDERSLSDEAFASCKDRGAGTRAYRDCLDKEYGRKDVVAECRDLGAKTVAYKDCLRANVDHDALKQCERHGYATQAFVDCLYGWHETRHKWPPLAREAGNRAN